MKLLLLAIEQTELNILYEELNEQTRVEETTTFLNYMTNECEQLAEPHWKVYLSDDLTTIIPQRYTEDITQLLHAMQTGVPRGVTLDGSNSLSRFRALDGAWIRLFCGRPVYCIDGKWTVFPKPIFENIRKTALSCGLFTSMAE